MSLTSHCQIHTNLGALTHKVIFQTGNNLSRSVLSNANHVLASKGSLSVFSFLHKLSSRSLALGAKFWGSLALMYITTNCANKFLFHW